MITNETRNRILSHRIINYLHAAYQGRFAFLNILSQLNHPDLKNEEISQTKEVLTRIHMLLSELWRGQAIFHENEKVELGSQAKEVLNYLETVSVELDRLATKTKKIISNEQFFQVREELCMLVAAYGRNAYARDNYVRGFIQYANTFNDNELLIQYKKAQEETDELVHTTGTILSNVKKNHLTDRDYYDNLRFFSATLPGAFRAQVHDISQLLNCFTSFTFEKAGFLRPEAEAWQAAGFSPIESGYWRAFEFGAAEALTWRALYITDPQVAKIWETAGFTPDIAVLWIQAKISPLGAIQWHNAGFSPLDAAVLIRKGFNHPAQVTEEILEEARQEILTASEQSQNLPQKK